jgi:tetrahydromethanopterin S-methyltransferase subunit G
MTHTEDIKRLTIMNEDYQDYLHNRIEALENRVQFLEKQLEISKQLNLKQ